MTALQKSTVLTQAWQAWIQENLARQCSTDSLVEAMVRDNFDAKFARASVEAVLQGLSAQSGTSMTSDALNECAVNYVDESPRIQRVGNGISTSDRLVRITLWMECPCIVVLDDFMSSEECDRLVEMSKAKLSRSTTVNPATGQLDVIDARSSTGTYFAVCENEFVATLDRRIAEVMNWPMENGEGIQILRYENGGEYKPHFDYFEPTHSGSQTHLAKGGQRVSTLVVYLSDVPEGGETHFPDLHLGVTPRKGRAVYFEYCNSLGQVDPRSLHAGLPVTQGVKWIATKWMRQHRYG
jgi:prolyl 4-hydroxylase